MKLFSVYAPSAEDPDVKHNTKADAETAEEGVVTKIVKVTKEKLTGGSACEAEA